MFLSAVVVVVPQLLIPNLTFVSRLALGLLMFSNPIFISQAGWFGSDLAYTAFLICSLLFFWKGLEVSCYWKIFWGGVFCCAAIYSKQTAIAFFVPFVLLISFYRPKPRQLAVGLLGVIAFLLLLSSFHALGGGDFWIFLSPESYIDFLARFNSQLSADRQSRPPTTSYVRSISEYSKKYSDKNKKPGKRSFARHIWQC